MSQRTPTFFYLWLRNTYLATVFCTLLCQLWLRTLSCFAASPHLMLTLISLSRYRYINLLEGPAYRPYLFGAQTWHSLERLRSVYAWVLMQRQCRRAVWNQPHYQQAAVAEARDEYHGSAKTLSDTILLYKFY
jgi:hypothetical protein